MILTKNIKFKSIYENIKSIYMNEDIKNIC